jgi:hypothetical protein
MRDNDFRLTSKKHLLFLTLNVSYEIVVVVANF